MKSLSTFRSRLPNSFPGYLKRCATVDTRSLAVFRMFAGVLIIADVLSRARSFHFYYTDDGVVTQALAEQFTRRYAVSIFFFTSDPYVIAALFIIHALVAIVLIFGYKTRIALFISFVFVISLDHHNPLVTSYADTLFRMLLFWALFLPLGERWSIDAIHRDRSPRKSIASFASAAIMIQMIFMYFVNGQNKFPSDLWHSGEAAIIVMGIDEMTFFLGDFMRNFPFFLQIGGRTWFYLLLISPLLFLIYGRLRYPLLLGFFGGHASFAITVRIGAFPYVAMLGLITFLQPRFWKDLEAVFARMGLSSLLATWQHDMTRAGTYLAHRLPGKLLEFPGRDVFVRKTLTVLVLVSMFGLFFMPAFAFSAQGPYLDDNPLPDDNPVENVLDEWNVGQPVWSIFAGPGPRNGDRYYVFPAQTTDGQVFDAYNERPLTYERPGDELQKQHDVYRMRFYMNSIRRQPHTPNDLLADWYCDEWAAEKGVELEYINMYTVREHITLETIDDPENRDRRIDLISRHSCTDAAPIDIDPPDDDF